MLVKTPDAGTDAVVVPCSAGDEGGRVVTVLPEQFWRAVATAMRVRLPEVAPFASLASFVDAFVPVGPGERVAWTDAVSGMHLESPSSRVLKVEVAWRSCGLHSPLAGVAYRVLDAATGRVGYIRMTNAYDVFALGVREPTVPPVADVLAVSPWPDAKVWCTTKALHEAAWSELARTAADRTAAYDALSVRQLAYWGFSLLQTVEYAQEDDRASLLGAAVPLPANEYPVQVADPSYLRWLQYGSGLVLLPHKLPPAALVVPPPGSIPANGQVAPDLTDATRIELPVTHVLGRQIANIVQEVGHVAVNQGYTRLVVQSTAENLDMDLAYYIPPEEPMVLALQADGPVPQDDVSLGDRQEAARKRRKFGATALGQLDPVRRSSPLSFSRDSDDAQSTSSDSEVDVVGGEGCRAVAFSVVSRADFVRGKKSPPMLVLMSEDPGMTGSVLKNTLLEGFKLDPPDATVSRVLINDVKALEDGRLYGPADFPCDSLFVTFAVVETAEESIPSECWVYLQLPGLVTLLPVARYDAAGVQEGALVSDVLAAAGSLGKINPTLYLVGKPLLPGNEEWIEISSIPAAERVVVLTLGPPASADG
jgi:hypothetical protein